MDFYQILSVFTCLTSTITMVLVAVAVVPHVKQGLTIIRDALLWATLVLVTALFFWAAWERLSPKVLETNASSTVHAEPAAVSGPTQLSHHADRPMTDPFYQRWEVP